MSPPKLPSLGNPWLIPVGMLLALAGAADLFAADRTRVTPSLDVRQEYQSNALHTDGGDSDFITRITPRLEASRDGDWGHARVNALVESRFYADYDELNGNDLRFGWDGRRNLTDRLAFVSDGRVAFYENQDTIDGFGEGRPDENLIIGDVGVEYDLSSRSILALGFRLREQDFSTGDLGTNDRRDSTTYQYSLSYRRLVTARDRMGLTTSYRQSEFSDIGTGVQDDDLISVVADWHRTWTPNWTTQLAIGARSLQTENALESDRIFGGLGSAVITRRLKYGEVSLSYQRDLQPSSGLGTTLNVDTFRALFRYNLTERLSLHLSGLFQSYQSAGDAIQSVTLPMDAECGSGFLNEGETGTCFFNTTNEIDSNSLEAFAELRWRLLEDLHTFFNYGYDDRSSSGTRSTGDYDNHRVMLGFRYAWPLDI